MPTMAELDSTPLTMAELDSQQLTMAEMDIEQQSSARDNSPKSDGIYDTLAYHIGKQAPDMIDRTINAGEDFTGGVIKGVADTIDIASSLNPITRPWRKIFDESTQKPINDLYGVAGDVANDTNSFPFLAGEVLSPVPTSMPTKALGLASDAVGATLKPINKLLGKATGPVVDKATDMLTRPSPVGSIRDWLKTQFVQDYKLSDKFVDMVDTELRRGKVQNDQVMDAISSNMSGLSSFQRDIVQYLVSKDKVAFPDIHNMTIAEPHKFDAIVRKHSLYKRSNTLKNQIWKNEDDLVDVNMVGSDYATDLIQNRQAMDQMGFPKSESAYVNRQYKDREALKDRLDPNLQGGRTLKNRRGLYDNDGNYERKFTDLERTIMKPETKYVAEKSIAKQLDKVLQGRVMDRTFAMKELIKTPDEMKKFIGGTPRSEENGYTLLQGSEYGNLSGNYVQTQTANRLKSMIDDVNREPSLWNNYRKYVGQWKAAVTIKNPKTHINNMLGNTGMMITASDIPASKVTGILSDGIKIHGEGKGNTVYDSALRAGLLERTKVQELAQMSGFDNSVSKVATGDSKLKTVGKNLYMSEDSAVGKKVFGAYQAEDEIFKLGIFDHYLKQGMKAKDARKATEKIVFDYAKKLPRGVEFLRDTGLIPFVTWSYRSLPMFADVLKNRPGQLLATATALAVMNDKDDAKVYDDITRPTVGSRKIETNNFTPYMEYLNPQQFMSDQVLSGIPQQVAAIASGNKLNFGRMRTLDRKGMTATDSLFERGEAIKDLLPIPDVYNDLFDPLGQSILDDVKNDKRSIGDSSIHRLLFTNSPKKSSRKRKHRVR